MTDLRFKNIFITQTFIEIDRKRAELKMETVLPLTRNERKSFVELTTLKLVNHEYRIVIDKSVFLLFSTLHVCGVLLADYSLFWLMSIIEYHGHRGIDSGSQGESCWIGFANRLKLFLIFKLISLT